MFVCKNRQTVGRRGDGISRRCCCWHDIGGVEEKKREQGHGSREGHLFLDKKQNPNNCFESTSNQGPRLARHFAVAIVLPRPSVLLSQRLVPMPMPTHNAPRRIKVTNPDQTDACIALKQWPCGPGRGAAAPGQR